MVSVGRRLSLPQGEMGRPHRCEECRLLHNGGVCMHHSSLISPLSWGAINRQSTRTHVVAAGLRETRKSRRVRSCNDIISNRPAGYGAAGGQVPHRQLGRRSGAFSHSRCRGTESSTACGLTPSRCRHTEAVNRVRSDPMPDDIKRAARRAPVGARWRNRHLLRAEENAIGVDANGGPAAN